MVKQAVIFTGGKQYLVKENDVIVIDKLEAKEKEMVEFAQVLLMDDGSKVELGHPYLPKISVKAEVLKQDKGEKVRVARFKAKSKYRRVNGFRAMLTEVKVLKIG